MLRGRISDILTEAAILIAGLARSLVLGFLFATIAGAAPAGGQAPDPNAPRAAIQWQDWSPGTFARARAEGKPILLDVQASWSRSTLYVEEAVYSDPEVITLANQDWIPVRVDRDRRPDIDLRYQTAVFIIARGEKGWPLTLFLNPAGEALFGGGYIAVEDRRQKPGMRTLLKRIATLHRSRPEAGEGTLRVVKMAFDRMNATHRDPAVTAAIVDEVGSSLASSLDREYGGFGGVPRLPRPFAVDLAATLYQRKKDPAMLDIVVRTLHGMERGAINDRVGGGFHRMSTDAAWRHPEFEKLTTYNATILRNYLTGYVATGDPLFRRTAERTLDYMLETLAHPGGGFYVGQRAASHGLDPIGLFYAWSEEEFLKAIPEPRHRLARMLFNVTREGDLILGDPARNLLYVVLDRAEAAERLGIPLAEVDQGEADILRALAEARKSRTAPAVEQEVYVDSSALGALAMIDAWRVLGREDARAAAIATVDRLIAAAGASGQLLHRVHPPPVPGEDPALALDHVMLADAALAAWEEFGDDRYLAAARDMTARITSLFWDGKEGGVFDITSDPNAPGYMSVRLRLERDIAYPSLNAEAAMVLDRLWLHTGDASYRERAESCLRKLISLVDEVDVRDAGLALAVESHLRPPSRYVIVGAAGDEAADRMYDAARRIFDPGKLVVRLEPGRDDEAISRLGAPRTDAPFALSCSGTRCSDPVRDADDIGPPPVAR